MQGADPLSRKHPLPRSTPEAQGISSSAITNFVNAVEVDIRDLHSFMLMRHGHVIAEGWWEPYGPTLPHMLFSLSKSFTSTAVGMAVAEGRLSVDDTVISLLPDDVPGTISVSLASMRVRHLLSMSTGNDQDTMPAIHASSDTNWARTILAQPVEHEPGTHFVYNSGATYLLSAIIQKLIGQRLLHYLTPRLFEPLEIEGATWQTCPRGIDTGGWGLKIKAEDIANFGQLYLQKGKWNGRQLVPASWVDEASSIHISNAGQTNGKDWTQGYGYQFWRCQHNAYRGDGAFGQYCVVMPDQDAVLTITSGVANMQIPLDKVWEHLLPAMTSNRALPENAQASSALLARLKQLGLRHSAGQATSPTAARVSGKPFSFPKNDLHIEAASLSFEPTGTTLTLWDKFGQHDIACGSETWLKGSTKFGDGEEGVVAASGAWVDENTYVAKLYYYETPFASTLTLHFTGDGLELTLAKNVSFGPVQPTKLVGQPAGEATPQ